MKTNYNRRKILKNLLAPVFVLVFLFTLTACSSDPEREREIQQEENKRYQEREDFLKTPEGQAQLKKEQEEQQKREKDRALKEKWRKDAEWRERYENNKIGTLLWTANEKIVDAIMKYEDQPEGEIEEIFKIGSDLEVFNGGTNATFMLDQNVYVTEIWTYHWNDGKGSPAGTITLIEEQGDQYGPFRAELQNGVYWVARPNQTIPVGNYIVIDSNPATWSQNSESHGQGMTWMNGIYIN